MDNYSRRSNLLFQGIPESVWNVKLYIQDLCKAVGITNPRMERVHRLGRYASGRRPRPIIARFTYYEDRDHLWKNKWQLRNATDQRGDSFERIYIEEDHTEAVRDKKKISLQLPLKHAVKDSRRL